MTAVSIQDYDQARDYLRSFVDFERRGFKRHFADAVNLDTIRALLAELGDPQDRFPCLHVAGTKGKGSTCALAEAALRAAGYRTGLYTSPHLITMRERIRLDGVPISELRLVELLRQVAPAVETVAARPGLNPPTFFELHTALAFLAFAQEPVDVAVVEVGLGGRLDATNVVQPLVTAISTVGYDHMDLLGDTLEQIAGEKAGILKPGVPLALGMQPPAAEAAILSRAQALGVPVRRAPACRATEDNGALPIPQPEAPLPRPVQQVALATPQGELAVALPLLGSHQRGNLTLAWAAVEALGERGLPVTPEQFARGVAEASWPGRMQVLAARPWLVLDCAHNQPSLAALASALPAALSYRRLIVVLGMSADKQPLPACAALAPAAVEVILTQAYVRRALGTDALAAATRGVWRTNPRLTFSVREALALAAAQAGAEDCICVTGSIFAVGEAMRRLGLEPS